ncbi:winged helix DNA-binding domain-containing protein [Horticoccus luteus]|uniref:Winged helix DNA-binding domain-containing protein n=1 Tax=Horticoccus luteus TaxID=2862869 RepID=A0A8F9TXC5_9BACT|nr:crosslink repair DNA glycosylase YcaQ family protein [Horticoccus luteus]QYM79594.1 winged helix DNA-binding domain-containing protein [Horticoccus luteus]
MPPTLTLSAETARLFLRRSTLLDSSPHTLAQVIAHLGYVQIDPINVCGRMHDLILRNRVTGYREGDLMRHLHGDGPVLPAAARSAFEHHHPFTHNLAAFPLDAWPHLLAAMDRRTKRPGAWSGRLTPRERELVPEILAEIQARGPLNSDSFTDPRKARRVWGAATLAKATLQKLFFHGRLLISSRVGARRLYDLPERVLPAATLALHAPPPGDTDRWIAQLRLQQHRLVALKRAELPLVEDLVQPVRVADGPLLYCLRTDAALLEASAGVASDALLLAPLDPIIYHRPTTRAVWDFDYTWEVYTPPHKRTRGYYALPLLVGTQIVGHVDPKADREQRKLVVVNRSVRRGYSAAPAVRELTRFLGLNA